MTDTFELEKKIREKGLTKKDVAQHLGISLNGFILKLTNKNEFKASEIQGICDLLKLTDNSIFFKEKVN